MPAERVSMRKIREVLRLTHALGMSRRLVGEATGIGKTAVGEYVRRAAVAGLRWPLPDEIDDAELERRLFPPRAAGSSAARTDPDWSHIHTEMKRRGVTLALLWQEYRGEHARRLRLQLVLRAVQRLAQAHHADDAPDACGRREAVRRLGRRCHRGVRSHHGRRAWCAHLCRGARRVELHLCGSTLDRDAAGLDRRACERALRDRRRAEGSCVRQPQGRHHQALALRAGHQPHLSGFGRPLWLRGAADAGEEATRQGEGRGRGSDRRAVRAGQAAEPTLLLARRAERGSPRMRCHDQRQGDEEVRQEPTGAAGDDRPSGAQGAAERALSIRRVEALRCRARLPRRGRRSLLLGAVPAVARDGRGAAHRHHRRGLPQGHSSCEPSAVERASSAHDNTRAHAELAPPLRRLDTTAHDA